MSFHSIRPLLAENARSVKTSEGPLLRIFSLTENTTQCLIMIVLGNKSDNYACLVLSINHHVF